MSEGDVRLTERCPPFTLHLHRAVDPTSLLSPSLTSAWQLSGIETLASANSVLSTAEDRRCCSTVERTSVELSFEATTRLNIERRSDSGRVTLRAASASSEVRVRVSVSFVKVCASPKPDASGVVISAQWAGSTRWVQSAVEASQ